MIVNDKVTKVRWNDMEKAQVLQEAGRIKLKKPDIKDLDLIRIAQTVLPKNRQREKINSVTIDQYEWFRETLPHAIEEAQNLVEAERVQEEREEVERVREKQQEDERRREQERILDDARRKAREEQEAAKAQLPVPVVQAPPLMHPDIALAVVGLLDRIGNFIDAATALANGGVTITLHVGKTRPAGQAAPQQQQQPQAQQTQQTPAWTNLRPPTAAATTRKAKVVVLSLESGHKKHGVINGTKGRFAQIECWDTPKKEVTVGMFSAFDYVICTKTTPTIFVEACKRVFPEKDFPGKIRVVQGNAIQIVAALERLPDIAV